MKDWKELYFKEYQHWFDAHLDGGDVAEIIERQLSFINSILSQQRKEVLEEVKGLLNNNNTELFGENDYIYLINEIKSLINKQ